MIFKSKTKQSPRYAVLWLELLKGVDLTGLLVVEVVPDSFHTDFLLDHLLSVACGRGNVLTSLTGQFSILSTGKSICFRLMLKATNPLALDC